MQSRDALAREGTLKFVVPDGHVAASVNHVVVRHGLDFDAVDAYVRERGGWLDDAPTTASRALGPAQPSPSEDRRWVIPTGALTERPVEPSPTYRPRRRSSRARRPTRIGRGGGTGGGRAPPARPGANGHKPGQTALASWRAASSIATTRCVVGARRTWTIHSPNGVRAFARSGTASYGFHAAPPFDVVDPQRPEPLTLVVRGAGGWPREVDAPSPPRRGGAGPSPRAPSMAARRAGRGAGAASIPGRQGG